MKPTAAPIAVQRSWVVEAASIAGVIIAAWAIAATPAAGQTPARPASPTNAPAANVPAAAATPPTSPVVARKRIELSPADRSAIDKANADSTAPGKPDDGLVPTPADLVAPPTDERQTRIEQVRTSNRISEVIVTPGLGTPSFVMTNRDGRQPLTQTDMGGGLSVPKFFRWEFGAPAPAPLALPPPPPTR
jgi:hypothetical protein